MGSYLDVPETYKHPLNGPIESSGKNISSVRFGACEMQGWRITMEDAIICEVDVAPGVHFFGVYDGHGGKHIINNHLWFSFS